MTDEESFQRTVDVPAPVFARALCLGLVQKNVLVADRAEFEWRID
jgi:hypothetical protein